MAKCNPWACNFLLPLTEDSQAGWRSAVPHEDSRVVRFYGLGLAHLSEVFYERHAKGPRSALHD